MCFNDEKIIDIVYAIASELRREGISISTSEILDSIQIMRSYADITCIETRRLSFEELTLLIDSTLSKGRISIEKLRKLIERAYNYNSDKRSSMQGIEKDLAVLGLTFGSKIPRNFNKKLWLQESKREAYLRLKALGIIKKNRGIERVVSRGEAFQITKKIDREYGGYEKAIAATIEELIKRNSYNDVFSLLGKTTISYLQTASIVKILRKLIKDKPSSPLLSIVTNELKKRISNDSIAELGSLLESRDLEYMLNKGLISEKELAKIFEAEPRLASRLLRRAQYSKRILEAIKQVKNVYSLSYLIPKYLSRSKTDSSSRISLLHILTSLPSYTLINVSLKAEDIPIDLKTLITIASIEQNVIKGIEEDNKGYFDLAVDELRRLERNLSHIGYRDAYVSRRIEDLKKLLEVRENPISLRKIVLNMNIYDAFRLLTALAQKQDKRLRMIAAYLLRILTRRLLSINGDSRGPIVKSVVSRGRVNVFETIRKILYYDDRFLVYNVHSRIRRVVAVLDKSGSMRPYSLIALLSIISMTPLVRRLVLFDDRVIIFDKPKISQTTRLINLLLSTRFEGYTDIVLALSEASKGLKASKLVLVSDLRQTVYSPRTLEATIKSLSRRGWKITIVAPPTIDYTVLNSVKDYVKYHVVSTIDELRRVMRRVV